MLKPMVLSPTVPVGPWSMRPLLGEAAWELVATGASTIGTACPFCNSMFRDALGASNGTAPQLLDIAQLVARSLPSTSSDPSPESPKK